MCIRYRFYHLCGHTHRITTSPCAYTPAPLRLQPVPKGDAVSSSPGSPSPCRSPTCLSCPADWLEEIRLLPILCAQCEQVGVISDWLGETPGSRFEVVRAWSKKHKPDLHKQPTLESDIAELEISNRDDRNLDSGSTATDLDMIVSVDQQSLTTRTDSVEPTKPMLTSRLHETTAGASSLRARMAALKVRVIGSIAELRQSRP
jgi:hypothetical protein